MKAGLLVATLLALVTTTAVAQGDPPFSFDPDDRAQGGVGLDTVSTHNGQLSLSIPIGPLYIVTPGLSMQLQLHYSSRVWVPGQWKYYCPPNQVCPPSKLVAEPFMVLEGNPALGLGWRFSFGQIVERSAGVPLAYFAPDGSIHQLYNRRFHRNPSSDPSGFFYTRDGTYLRVKYLGAASGYQMWSPTGNLTTFGPAGHVTGFDDTLGYLASDYGRGRKGWHATSIGSPYGTTAYGDKITITYQAAPFPWVPATVTIPSIGGLRDRVITVELDATRGLITGFTVPVFSKGSSSYTTAKYKLVYDTPFRQPLDRPIKHPDTRPTPHFLDRIDLPVTGYSHSFTYWDSSSFAAPQTSYARGALKTQTTPMGATATYEYGTWTSYHANPLNRPGTCSYPPGTVFPRQPILRTGPGIEPALIPVGDCAAPDRMAGVVRRTLSVNSSVTNYYQYSLPNGESAADAEARTETLVVSPADDAAKKHSTTYLYRASAAPPVDSPLGISDPLVGALLRVALFTNDASLGYTGSNPSVSVCSAGANFCTTQAKRVRKFTWEVDSGDPNAAQTEANRRVKSAVTIYNAIPADQTLTGTYHQIDYQYDESAGAYSGETHSGNVGGTYASDARDVRSTWTPVINASDWNLRARKTTELRATATSTPFSKTSSTFDSFGNVLSTTITDGAGFGTLEHAFSRDTHGFWKTESWTHAHGGNTSTYTKTLTFLAGSPESSKWSDSSILWKDLDNTVDSATGLLVSAKDPNIELKTEFTYDALGRPETVTPPGGDGGDAPITYTYPSTRQTVTRRVLSGREYDWTRQTVDPLGRPIKIERHMPASTTAKKVFRYDAQGHRVFESEWVSDSVADSSAKGTSWTLFDDFGRPGRITKADSTTTDINYTDGTNSGADWLTAITVNNVGGQPATTIRRTDVFGNLVRVIEPTLDETTYSYDPMDHLIQVKQGEQTRQYTYDAFGFLREETVPERNNLKVTYQRYDAVGNLLAESNPGHTTTLRSYSYDKAGRLLASSAGGQTYVKNEYDGQVACVEGPDGCPNGGSHKLARLTRKIGYNPRGDIPATIVEDYFYSERTGRLSRKETRVTNGGTRLTSTPVIENWVYDPAGSISQYSHPRTSGAFVVSTQHDHGYPTAVSINGFPVATAVTYHPAGMLASYKTGIDPGDLSDRVTTITRDQSDMARPARIRAAPARDLNATLFDTGQYSYDGTGNVATMGADKFTYDKLSRLLSAEFPNFATQAYKYDRYGNLLERAGVNVPVNTATNRLYDPTNPSRFTYDDRGNLTKAGGEEYRYDDFDRIARYTKPPNTAWDYVFDGDGERLIKAPSQTPVANYTWTFRDVNHRIATEFLGAVPSRDLVYLGDVLVASYRWCAVPTWTYYSSDHIGTPRLLSGVGDAHLDLRRYWPFGELASSLDPYSTERLGLGQMERDLEANRYYDHARSLDVTVARFLSVDSVGGDPFAPQSLNRYTYALSNPLKYQDPNGKVPWLAAGVIGAGALIEGGFRVYDYKGHHPHATSGELWEQFAIGGAAGGVSAAVGMGLTRVPGLKNPFVIGAAVAETDAIVTQAMEMAFKYRAPGDWDASDIAVKTALGAFMGKLAELRYPTEFGAAVPHYWKSRAFREIGQLRGRGRNVSRQLDNRLFEAFLITSAFRVAEQTELARYLPFVDAFLDYLDPDVDVSIGVPEGRVDETWTWRPIDDDTSESPLPDVQWD